MDRNEQIAETRRLGAEHGHAVIAPYGDLDDAGSADLMTALGETGPTTAENHDWRAKLAADYGFAWQYAAGRDYMTPAPSAGTLTPRRFVLALAGDGLDADLEILGGPGSWPLPLGYLPDGRSWILSDEDDAGWVGPDAPIPGRLHLQVYESAQENAGRWPDRHGLDFNDPLGILADITPARAEQAIRRAWHGDYTLFTGDQIGPAPLPEDSLLDEVARGYVRAVRLAPPAVIAPWRTDVCPACGQEVHGGGVIRTGDQAKAHVLIRGCVAVDCEGGFVIDPAALGLDPCGWADWRGEQDAAYINDDGPGHGYSVTCFGEYVGDSPYRTYPAALDALRAHLDGLDVAGAPAGWQPDVYYHQPATGALIKFPYRLAEVREDFGRPTRMDDLIWHASLGPHIGLEALCLLCGATFNPGGPGDLTHGVRLEGDELTGREVPCGGPGVFLGAWGAGAAAAPESARQLGIPYAWTDPDNGGRHCPACQAVIAEDYDADGEPLTRNYADHYLREHRNR
jgi:hypothetical protein